METTSVEDEERSSVHYATVHTAKIVIKVFEITTSGNSHNSLCRRLCSDDKPCSCRPMSKDIAWRDLGTSFFGIVGQDSHMCSREGGREGGKGGKRSCIWNMRRGEKRNLSLTYFGGEQAY